MKSEDLPKEDQTWNIYVQREELYANNVVTARIKFRYLCYCKFKPQNNLCYLLSMLFMLESKVVPHFSPHQSDTTHVLYG